MKRQLFRKSIALLLSLVMLMSLLPIAALADGAGEFASVDITVNETAPDNTQSEVDSPVKDSAYTVQVAVTNNRTYSITPSVTLYEIRSGAESQVGTPASAGSMAAGASDTLNFTWIPSAAGLCTLKAVVVETTYEDELYRETSSINVQASAAAVNSITVTDGTDEVSPVKDTEYTVKVGVQNNRTYVISPSVTLYDVTGSSTIGTVDSASLAAQTETPVSFTWTPSVSGDRALKASVTIDGETVEKTVGLTVSGSGEFSGGSGTESDPYQMSTEADLRALATELSGGSFDTAGVYFVQTADIDVSSGGDWAPIGGTSASSGVTCFKGDYDGQNYKITGLSLNGDYNGRCGLFGFLDCDDGGSVRLANIRLVEPEIINSSTSATRGTGGITAGIYQSSRNLNLTIENCVIEDGTIQSATANTGGIAGYLYVSAGKETTITISGCAVLDTEISGTYYVGGITGYNSTAKYAYMKNCCVSGGSVEASSYYAGGIAGYFGIGSTYVGGSGEMSGCFSTASVTADSNNAGGLCGYTRYCTIKNCYATGDVAGTFYAGGVAGSAGSNFSMQNVFASGTVTVTAETSKYSIAAGGLLGTASASTDINNNVAMNTEIIHSEETDAVMGRVSGSATTTVYGDNYAYEYMIVDGSVPSDSGVGVTTSVQGGSVSSANLKTKAFWEGLGFDFTDTTGAWIWNGTDGDGYPTLNGFSEVTQSVAVSEDDTTSPALSDVTAGPLTVGNFLSATSSKNGRLYLVPSATTATREAIVAAAANGAAARAWAEEPADLSTAGLTAGSYVVYAIDGLGNVSLPSAAITVNAADTTLADVTWYTDDPSADKFTLTTAKQLNGLRMLVAGNITGYTAINFSGQTITLGSNIDLSTVCSSGLGSWTPIGTVHASFTGTFDGAGHAVSNLYIDSANNNQGLFGYAGGTIENVVVNGTVIGGSNVGAVIGTSTGTVKNCTSLASVSGTGNVGGIAGSADTIGACIYYKEGGSAGVAGSAASAAGCYYLAESALAGAIGEAKTTAEFATREMAYLMDTATGSHADEWQMGASYPVLGDSTVYYVSLAPETAQANKSVALRSTAFIDVYTSGDTQYAYLIKGEFVSLDVTSDNSAYAPVFYPDGVITESGGEYSIAVSAADVSLTYRFAQSVSADTSWYHADGTEFTLTTEAQLRGLASLVNESGVSFEGKIIYLGNDIPIVGDLWPMIGNKTNKFYGTFDGNNHTISGFYIKITSTDSNIYKYQGFFGYLNSQSTVQNLKLDGTVADGKYFCGILAGYADEYCTISNCTTSGTVLFTDSTQTRTYAAGMLGDLDQYGIMTDCINNADVIVSIDTLSASSTSIVAAGLICYLDPYGAVTNCINNGTVSYEAGDCGVYTVSPILGGIVGIDGGNITVTDCTNNGAITGSGIATSTSSQTSLGGIIGSGRTDVITGCINNAEITCTLSGGGSAYAGGISSGSNRTYSGSSSSYNLTVDSCVNSGKVDIVCKDASDVAMAGGIVGGSGIALAAITGCSNTGAISITCPDTVTGSNTGAGGIIGSAFNMSADAEIAECVNSGTVTAAANYVGGVTAQAGSGLLITDCYNTASITGADYVGGLVGSLSGTLQSSFNYGGSVAATSGSNVGVVIGSGAADNVSGAYYLSTTGVTGAATAADASYTTSATADGFKSYDMVYALNSIGSTVEDRCVWKQGDTYPQFALGETTPVYVVRTTAGNNGNVSGSADGRYLTEGDTYTVTFAPASGYILKNITVSDISGNSYNIYLNSVENGVYSVTLEDTEGDTYDASFSQNVLSCTMDIHSLTFTGEFTAEVSGSATVTLNANGGWFNDNQEEATDTLNVSAGAMLTLADLTKPEGYLNFVGWYTDAAGTEPFNFSTAITADTTIYAKWDTSSCVVFYRINGGSWSAKNYTTVTTGACLTEPAEAPVKEGCTFTGWYGDEACLNPFDFENTAITGETYLYAGWVTSGYVQVIFDPNGGTIAGSSGRLQMTFMSGTSIGSALDTYTVSNDGMNLRGWYSSATGGSKWALNGVLTEDRILYAHWDAADGTPTIYSGTENEPMELEDLDQLEALRDNVNAGNSYEGGCFEMAGDLTLPADWVPIGSLKPGTTNEGTGTNIYPFSGTFDGGNNTLTVPEGGLPLFGYVREAAVQNLNIYGTKIAGYGLINNYTVDYGSDGSYYTGTGGSYAAGCPDTVVIDNVTLKSGSSTLYSGFIGGYASGGNTVAILDSTVESGVVIGYAGTKSSIGSFAGGINGTVTNCVSAATVYGVNYVGGILGGKGQSMGDCAAVDCAFTGTILSTGNYVGGIIGGGYSSSSAPNSPCVTVQNCYVTGSITGANDVGGILGAEPNVTQCWANGIGYIQNNYFAGTLSATDSGAYIGGIVGYMKSLDRYNIIENNYYLNTSAQTGIGQIDAIDYTTSSYSRSETFAADDVCTPTASAEFGSGKIAALLNSGENSSGTWTQSGTYPVLGTVATATYSVTLGTIGTGTASVTGLTMGISTVYQNAGGTVSISATAGDGYEVSQIKTTYADGTITDITSAKEFTMPQQNTTVYVTFTAEGETYATGIEIESQPTITSYKVGDSFNVSGLTFKVTYNDGSAETLPATSDMVSGFSSASAGTKTLTLTYLGCTATFTVKVTAAASNTISVKFRLIGSTLASKDIDLTTGDYNDAEYVTWIKTTKYTLDAGSTMYDLFTEALDDAGLTSVGADSNYVQTICAPSVFGGYALSEFTNGKYSGWMYTVNGSHPDQGIEDYELSNGDKVVWHYVDDYRYEVEDWFDDLEYPSLATDDTYYNKWLSAADVSPTSSSSSSSNSASSDTSTTLTPTATASSGKASVTLKTSDLTDAIGSAKDSDSSVITISPEISGAASKVTVTIPKTSVSSIGSDTDADLKVETDVGSITISNGALDSIASQASGSTVTMSLENVDNSFLTAQQQAAVGDDPVYDISIMSGDSHISSFDGTNITVSLPYTLKDGEDASNVTVWYLNDAGELEQMSCTYDEETGLATFTTTHLSYYVVGYSTAWTNPFTDVTEDDWYFDAVEYAAQNELMGGTTLTTFKPDSDMTRAMLVTVLYRLEGEPTVSGTNSFMDVDDGWWYTDAVIWASEKGIVAGYGDNLFGTNDSITREQMATILYRYAQYKGYDTTQGGMAIREYVDYDSISDYTLTALAWAVNAGLMQGSDNSLSPSGSATRAQVATILMRFCENIVE